jgi:hypothetical protein
MPLELFPFRYRDARTGRWVKARYKGTPEEIAIRYAEWEITGPAELRSDVGGAFNPYRFVPHAELRRLQEEAPEINPHLARPPAVDAIEWVVVGCVVVAIFLRRYVTYCACRRRYSQMESAARLHREIVTARIALDAQSHGAAPSLMRPTQPGGSPQGLHDDRLEALPTQRADWRLREPSVVGRSRST